METFINPSHVVHHNYCSRQFIHSKPIINNIIIIGGVLLCVLSSFFH